MAAGRRRVRPPGLARSLPGDGEAQQIELDRREEALGGRAPRDARQLGPEGDLEAPGGTGGQNALERPLAVVSRPPGPPDDAGVEGEAPVAAGEAAGRAAQRQAEVGAEAEEGGP